MGWQIQNPPRNGEVADAKRLTEGAHLSASDAHDGKVGPLHHPADGPPPRSGEDLAETRAVAGWVLDQILVVLHPFMPFVTEELWHAQGERGELIVARWPEPQAKVDAEATSEVEWLIGLMSEIRSTRTEYSIPWKATLPLWCEEHSVRRIAAMNWKATLERITRAVALPIDPSPEVQRALDNPEPGVWVNDNRLAAQVGHGIQIPYRDATFVLGVGETIDIEAEKARLTKALDAARKEANSLAGRRANPAFVERAKPEAVEKARADHAHHAAEVERLEAALGRLG